MLYGFWNARLIGAGPTTTAKCWDIWSTYNYQIKDTREASDGSIATTSAISVHRMWVLRTYFVLSL